MDNTVEVVDNCKEARIKSKKYNIEFRQKITFDITQYFQKEFQQKITLGMIFEKSYKNGDFDFFLAGPKFDQTFKPIRLLTSQKRYTVYVYIYS